VLLKGRKNRQTYLFAGLTLLAGIWSLFPFATGQSSTDSQALDVARLLYLFALFVPPVFLHLTFALLDLPKTARDRLLLTASYVLSVLFLPALPTAAFIQGVLRFRPFFAVVPGPFYTAYVLFFGTTCAIGFIKLLEGYRNAIGIGKNQLRYIFVSWFLAYIAGLMHFMPAYFHFEPFPHDFLLLAFVPISTYAIVRYRLLDIRLAFARTTIFALVYAPVLGIPFFVGYVGQEFLTAHFGRWWWAALLTLGAFFATLGPFLYTVLQRRAEERLMAEQRRYQSVLRQASQGMTLIKDLNKLLRLIVHLLTQKVRIRHAAIYLWDPQMKKFVPSVSRQWSVKDPDTFSRDHPLVEYLHWHRMPIVTEELGLQARSGSKELQPVVAALKAIEAAVMVPSFTEDRCEGFLLLGEKLSGALFTSDDLQVFQVLASQAALAIENAQFYEELKRTQTDLFQTAKMASLGHMAGGMSHQINNRFHVLTILSGTLRSVMKDLNPMELEREKIKDLWDKTLETLAKLEDNALRGGEIVKTLLRFSRPAGDYKPVALRQIIATSKEVAQFRVNMGLIDLTEEIPESLPPVKGDLNQLADSCFNLLTNAYDAVQKKATMISEGKISPSPNDPTPFRGKIWIRAYPEKTDGKLLNVLEVQDNGTGMTSGELDNLFVPFFTTKATAQKGTGLGLYVIQRIVERHGGSITAASKVGAGTTFIIRLPAAVETPQSDPAHA